jgi:uncharacterized membrane protein
VSLKAFHIVFVIVTVLASLVVGGLFGKQFLQEGGVWNAIGAVGSLAVAVGLIYYGKYVLRKLKHISYL